MNVLDLSRDNLNLPEPHLIRSFRHISQGASILVIIVGFLVLIGWVFDLPNLKSVLPRFVTMKANTAIGFVLAGTSLFLLADPMKRKNRTPWLAHGCSSVVALIGGLTLCEYLFGWDLGIDRLVFQETGEAVGTSVLGRMSPLTAFNFFIIGFALISLDFPSRDRITYFLVSVAGFVSLTAFLGYAYGIKSFYGIAAQTEMALHTSLAFGALSLGVLFSRPDRGLMKIVASDCVAGIVARRLLPSAVVVPVALGSLRLLGQRMGFYSMEFGLSLTVLFSVVIFVSLIGWNVVSLHRLDSERKLSEQTLARLAAIVDSSDEGIISTTLDGTIFSWNKAAERIYGYSADEVIGLPVSILVPPDRPGEITDLMERIKSGERIQQYETVRLRKDGQRIHVCLTASPIKADKKIIGFSGIIHDISEQKRIEEMIRRTQEELERRVSERTLDLQRANERLQRLDEMKSDFIALASHELKTPLTAIEGFLAVILKGMVGEFTDQQKEFLGVIKGATERLNRLVDELLDFSKIDSGQVKMKREPTDLGKLLKEEVIVFKMQAKNKEIELGEIIDDRLNEILCDRDRLKEVLDNLISNAIKYTPKRGKIMVEARNFEDSVQIEVRDTGIGIRVEDQEKIFEPFQHLRKSGLDGEKSTGLGLALVKKIIEAQGGRVAVRSNEGVGSAFLVTLPIKR